MPFPVAVISGLVGPGVLYSPLVPNLIIGNFPVAVTGNLITGHGLPPHSPSPQLIATQQKVRCGPAFLPLCRATDIATCGDIALPGPNTKVILFP
jgi:hypothetical protein